MTPLHRRILERLASVCEQSPDVRFGQMVSMIGILAEDLSDRNLWVIEDRDLLAVVEKHLQDLERRQQAPAKSDAAVLHPDIH
jgi:hypothetical protein